MCEFCSADDIRQLFSVIKFSETGSNSRVKEECAYMNFLEYLDECEKSKQTFLISLFEIGVRNGAKAKILNRHKLEWPLVHVKWKPDCCPFKMYFH